jgi:hypothetical protein
MRFRGRQEKEGLVAVTPEELEKIGRKLYGSRNWISTMAGALGVPVSTVWRWTKGGKMSVTAETAVRAIYAQNRQNQMLARTMKGKQ